MNIDQAMMDRIVDKVLTRLSLPYIELEASGRHMHLSREAVDQLFGVGYQLTRVSDLSQPGQFVCKERLKIIGPKGEFPSVVVLGPERQQTQLEVSQTDAMALGIPAPVRISGDTANTPGIRIVGPKGEYSLSNGVIVAQRHIHMTPDYAARFGLRDQQIVSVRVPGDRSVTFHNVALRVSADFDNYMHIDYDEANACGFKKGMKGIIESGN